MQTDGDVEMAVEKNIPFVEKYRPDSLDDIVSHTEIIETVTKFVEEKKLPHLLFHGPPGTGKTSCIIAIAKKMYGKAYSSMILELNASDDRGINVVRDKIKSFCSTQQIVNRGLKLVILDECDAITSAAQFALRRVVEKYTKTTRFCFICNYVSKVIPALQSRCTRFRFSPLKTDHVSTKLSEICDAENFDIDEPAKEAIVKLSRGDMRKVLNVLESASLAHDKIKVEDIYACTGKPSPEMVDKLMESCLNDDYATAVATFMSVKSGNGLTLEDLTRDIHLAVMKADLGNKRKIFLIKRLADIEQLVAIGCNEKLQVQSLIGAFVEARTLK
jgi:replication factor C subunit 3/5